MAVGKVKMDTPNKILIAEKLLSQLEVELKSATQRYSEGSASGNSPTFWEGKIAGLTFAIDSVKAITT